MSILHLDQTISVADKFTLAKDPMMRTAHLALNPQYMQNTLDSVMRRLFIGKTAELKNITVLRHKPGRYCVIEYNTLQKDKITGETRPFTVLGKFYGNHDGAAHYQLQQTLWRRSFGEHARDNIHIPQPLAHNPSLRAVFQRKVPAVSLTDLLATPLALPLMKRAADLAHKIHRAPAPAQLHRTIDDELRSLEERLAQISARYPQWKARIEVILRRTRHLAALVRHPVMGNIHGNFHSGQVLVGEDRVYAHDLDGYAVGDVGRDIGGFIGNLMALSLRKSGDAFALANLSSALEQRFVRVCGRQTRISIHAYAVIRVIHEFYLSAFDTAERLDVRRELLRLSEMLLSTRANNPMLAPTNLMLA